MAWETHSNALTALLAAALWGGGDFSGGMGVAESGGDVSGALRVIVTAHATSLLVLLLFGAARHLGLPHGAPLGWGLAGGVAAGLSLAAFYMALARGSMGGSAAVSGVLAAALPAVFSVWLDGAPHLVRVLGFAAAGVAIWLIAAGGGTGKRARSTALLAIAGGVGFGVYFVALRLSNPLGALRGLAVARAASTATCAALLFWLVRGKGTPGPWLSRRAWVWAMGVAVLDTGGNLLFLLATREGRLDVAAMLASLYPASTILLAAWQLHERPTRRQMAGMAAALGAVVLITL